MHPILFKLGPFTIYTYGFFLAVAFLAATWLVCRLAKSEGLDPAKLIDIGFFGILWGIIGSRIFYIFMNFSEYVHEPLKVIKIWEGGLVFYGGILGGILSTIILIRKYRLPFWKTLDILAPALALAQFIGRIGCFMAGCCYGRPTQCPWAVTFKHPNTLAPIGVSIHPSQLYHSFANLMVFLILFNIYKKRRQFPGQVFSFYLCIYSIARFLMEFFRGDKKIHLWGPLNLTQGISMILLICGIFLYRYLRSYPKG